jgi:hypothetical protein
MVAFFPAFLLARRRRPWRITTAQAISLFGGTSHRRAPGSGTRAWRGRTPLAPIAASSPVARVPCSAEGFRESPIPRKSCPVPNSNFD